MRIRGLSRKLRLSQWAIVCLAIVVALTTVGVTYAGMKGKGPKPPKDNVVVIYDYSDPFTWVATNDDGHLDYHDLYSLTDPVDPGDDGGATEYDYGWGSTSSDDPGPFPPPGAPPAPGDNFPRYTNDVARTLAQIEPDPRYITVTVENVYPYYYPTVFFTLECPGSVQGVITDIVIDEIADDASDPEPDIIDELTVTYSGIYIGQTIPAGGEIMGALHILVEQCADQNAGRGQAGDPDAYKIRLSITTEGGETTICCDTAYAYHEDYATCFIGMDELNNPPWGWTNGPLTADFYEFPLYAGAGGCDITGLEPVGTLTIEYYGSTAIVTYTMYEGYTMDDTHLYVGTEPLPRDKKGKYTVSPGQYPYSHDLDNATSDTYTITGLSGGDIYVVAHAVVGWFQ